MMQPDMVENNYYGGKFKIILEVSSALPILENRKPDNSSFVHR